MQASHSFKYLTLASLYVFWISCTLFSPLVRASTSRDRGDEAYSLPGPLVHRRVNRTLYKPLYQRPSNSTPRFLNLTHREVNPQRIAAAKAHSHGPRSIDLSKRQAGPSGTGTCAPGTPCSNGACCSKSGFCGYSPDFCGTANCISNCDAKAQCGQYAVAGKQKCPLNVCCSQYGFCGTTKDFCGTGCDSTGGSCGNAPKPSGSGGDFARSIGYYESWASKRPCDKMKPEDLDTTGFTHMNFAFAFFHPTTFQITPMDANAGSLLESFTNLKEKNRRLQTWISVGGWSFNDPGNNPDTRSAFSDMASSATNRGKFITSLMAFMRNHGFDGADIDWEYPAADDRGGKDADTANYVSLVKEMKASFGRKYGLSVTLPASYWYLQHFDVKGMQNYVDWFNVMTYDIHGVWDSSNRFTGPYVRPHTNLTEIDDGLSLLWRAGVSSSKVVMGLGFYGRAFKLSSASCTKPGCTFSSGATAGACTGASGILSLAEIGRTIDKYSLTPSYDSKAAVKWITFNSDQWVSYDDDFTFQQKMDYARGLGLSGTMVWAVDQSSTGSTSSGGVSSNDAYTGAAFYQKATGISKAEIATYQTQADAQDSCYTSFCGKQCAPGYTPEPYTTKGIVGELGSGSACKNGEVQQICCKTGTMTGECAWYGYRGQGLSCYGGQCPSGDTLVAMNTNHYFKQPEVSYVEDQTCNGGSQIYCCRGFQASMQLGRDADLLQIEDVETSDYTTLAKRDFKTCATTGLITAGVLTLGAIVLPILTPVALAAGAASSLVTGLCFATENEVAPMSLAGYSGPLTRGQASGKVVGIGSLGLPKPQTPKAQPKNPTNGGPKMYGPYPKITFTQGQTDCQLTYTCSYGKGFDQVCDNQRYGLDLVTNPIKVFTYDKGGSRSGRMKANWAPAHDKVYRPNFGAPVGGVGRPRCEIDEFPLNSLRESSGGAQQALRALDGGENGRQGLDWQFWLSASWEPCSALKKAAPPITWSIGQPTKANDPRTTAAPSKTIAHYGFDSVSGKDQCWATYSINGGAATTVKDHGFRVGPGDPLFVIAQWPSQNYFTTPSANAHPTDVASANFLKKRWGMEQWEFGDMTVPTKTADATLVTSNRGGEDRVVPTDTAKKDERQHVSPAEDQGQHHDTSAQKERSGTEGARATITAAPEGQPKAHLMNHAKGHGAHKHGHGL